MRKPKASRREWLITIALFLLVWGITVALFVLLVVPSLIPTP